MTHYERLGIRPDASPDEIRNAYRRLARVHHPDAHGGAASAEMADLNEAWRVLSDPGRRAMYDASLRPVTRTATRPTEQERLSEEIYPVASRDDEDRAHFPWGWVAILSVLAVIFFVTAGALRGPNKEPAPDNVLQPNSCVRFDPNGDAVEVKCSEPHDGVVDQLVTADTSCPIDTESHRDKQGLGKVCVRVTP